MEKWPVKSTRELYKNRILTVNADLATNPRNQHQSEYYRIGFPDWINVIALTENHEVILVRQYRHGSQEIELEVPGGCIDFGEDPLEAGMRELLEETGYIGDNAKIIGTVNPNPALQSNTCYTAFCNNARKIQEPELDLGEDIEILHLPLDKINHAILHKEITNSMVIAAFHYLHLLEE